MPTEGQLTTFAGPQLAPQCRVGERGEDHLQRSRAMSWMRARAAQAASLSMDAGDIRALVSLSVLILPVTA